MSCAWSVNKEAGATIVDDVVEGAADFTTVGETVAAMVYWMVVFNSMLELLGMVYLDAQLCDWHRFGQGSHEAVLSWEDHVGFKHRFGRQGN